VKFIFATTEPEKVIGTIRSRTHHYPFRLVPPAQLLDYVQQVCDSEGIAVDPGVLPLVVRAGGGSVRDTLSLLDQLIAGSEGSVLSYERAVGLLGYTHGELLDDAVDALGRRDAPALFAAVDRIIQTGQDPRRFVEDFLERLRDLVIVAATPDGAAALLRGVPQDQLDRMGAQAGEFGPAALSQAADITNAALTEMTGATSPRLHLELLAARLLVALGASAGRAADEVGVSRPVREDLEPEPEPEPVGQVAPAPAVGGSAAADGGEPLRGDSPAEAHRTSAADGDSPDARSDTPPALTLGQLRDAWPQVLAALESRRLAWLAITPAQVRAFDGDVLALAFPTQGEIDGFREHSEQLRAAILQVLGVRVKFTAKADGAQTAAVPTIASAEPVAEPPASPASPAVSPRPVPVAAVAAVAQRDEAPVDDWAVAQIPTTAPASAPADIPAPAPGLAPEPRDEEVAQPPAAAPAPRYGEAVVRQMLNARFIEDEPLKAAPAPTPIAGDSAVPEPEDPGPDVPEGLDLVEPEGV
jgi:DNA polymerase-3 subunit gamma/tau